MKYLLTIVLAFASLISVGQKIDNFSLKDVQSGKEVTLKQHTGKKMVVVLFFSNECAFTQHYIDRIKALNELLLANNSTLLLINSNSEKYAPGESEKGMKTYLSTNALNTPYLSDKKQEVVKMFGARRTPEAFVLQFEGDQAIIKYSGAIDDNPQSPGDVNHSFLNDAVRNLLANKKIATNSTRANGCLIK